MTKEYALYRGQTEDGTWLVGNLLCRGENRYISCLTKKGYYAERTVLEESLGMFTGLYDCTTWDELTYEEKSEFAHAVYRADNVTVPENKYDKYLELLEPLWKGRRIFTGDIVRHYNKDWDSSAFDMGMIVWDRTCLAFRRTSTETGRSYFLSPNDKYKVVGNFRDDPDLFCTVMKAVNIEGEEKI